jgi:RNA polymerase sigma-70 factor (ECF subfamily)
MALAAGSVGAWSDPTQEGTQPTGLPPVPPFEQIYDDNSVFIWRSLRGLGVADANVDDAVQEVFLVVHRRLPEYEPRAHIRSWLFGIAMRVAKDHRRSARRKPTVPLGDEPILVAQDSPFEQVARHQALAFVEQFLDTLNDEQRALFVLTELEQMRIPEAAEALGENVNTVYSRQRAIRKLFAEALAQNPEVGSEMSGGRDG